jgi:hypothetical protein
VEAIVLHNFGVEAWLDRLMEGSAGGNTGQLEQRMLDLELAVEQNLSDENIFSDARSV